ncbi:MULTISPECIES: FKBP-type peptidyl-prolyl cis-trans isomerase [Flavobacteriaceae]|uniref:FKBP-type peptidyl-prolyl cis-trans isomerase n=1 Tax=Flavobacteriaceae TaxID=49546 RepID=UPI0014916305|nr:MULTISPECIES: peptidylprolyl isomerase [Allomuricauda]MDC6367776.1 peptidylprolyl isomerase [Muricauda sp. AC10]
MKYGIIAFLSILVLFTSCNNDDGTPDVETVPPRLLSEEAVEDDAEIREFLQTHFYNYEEFDTPPAGFDYKIVIDTIAGDNSDKRSLFADAKEITVNVSASHFGLSDGEEDIPHKLYFIEAEKGGSEKTPTIADSVFVRYQGSLLDGTLFDETPSFIWQESPFTVRGYSNGIAQLFSGTSDQIEDNGDGTFDVANRGIGIVIMPSGLGYFNAPPSNLIPAYDNLLFKIELGLYVENTDNDGDGVPSILEDLNENGYLFDDNTDADDETFTILSDFRDVDDDGDGVSTRAEITDDNGNIILPYPDADNDDIPDYLDPDTN